MQLFANWSKKKIGYVEGIVSIIVNSILFGIKLWVGLRDNSIAIIADSWHTLADSISSAIVILSFFLASRPADEKHPFGHGRAELAASLVIGMLLLVVAADFTAESGKHLLNNQVISYSPIAIIICIISLFAKEILAQFSFFLGKKIKSSALKADGWHHRTDALATLLIIIGAAVSYYFSWIDGLLGILVSLLIAFTALKIIKDNISQIMGLAIHPDLKDEILNLVLNYSPAISDVHHFHFHSYGDHHELTFHLRVNGKMDVNSSHLLTQQLETLLKEKYGYEITIHVEPD